MFRGAPEQGVPTSNGLMSISLPFRMGRNLFWPLAVRLRDLVKFCGKMTLHFVCLPVPS